MQDPGAMLSMPADRSGTVGDLLRNGGLGDLGQAGSDPALPANFPERLGVLGESLRCQLPASMGPLGAQIAPQGDLVSACGLCHQAKACGHLAAVWIETGCCCCCCCCCRKSVSQADGRPALPALGRCSLPGIVDHHVGKLVCQGTSRS